MAAHTPGPWEQWGAMVYAAGENGANICQISEPRASTVVEFAPLRLGSPDSKEAYANGQLIAHAPDLADAAEVVVGLWRKLDADGLTNEEATEIDDALEAAILDLEIAVGLARRAV